MFPKTKYTKDSNQIACKRKDIDQVKLNTNVLSTKAGAANSNDLAGHLPHITLYVPILDLDPL